MSLAKALRAPHLFTQKTSGAGPAQIAYVTAVGRQWKLKELLLLRSTTGALTVNVYARDTVLGKDYLLAAVTGATTTTVRVSPTLSTGEFFLDQDTEIKVTTTGLGVAETWNLRVTGALIA